MSLWWATGLHCRLTRLNLYRKFEEHDNLFNRVRRTSAPLTPPPPPTPLTTATSLQQQPLQFSVPADTPWHSLFVSELVAIIPTPFTINIKSINGQRRRINKGNLISTQGRNTSATISRATIVQADQWFRRLVENAISTSTTNRQKRLICPLLRKFWCFLI